LTTQIPQTITLPALFSHQLDKPFCLLASGQTVSYADFLHHALSLSLQLPSQAYAINQCQDRYLFMVSYLAVLLRQQITLLPANQAPRTIKQLLTSYQKSYCLTDVRENTDNDAFVITWDLLKPLKAEFPPLDSQKPVSISFTSGSTGEPKAIAKTWAEFQYSAQLALNALDLENKPLTLVSTVPPQHMYGLETSLFWVLFSDLVIYNSRPFYPEDIRLILQSVLNPMLISTPTHLKSCVHSHSDWPRIIKLLSSTAPLSVELATQIEYRFHTPLLEIYGSTETLSFATRRAAVNPLWQPYQSIELYQQQDKFFVRGGHLSHPVALDDQFDITASGAFANLGRATDLIKIGGKRASLNELNRILTQLPAIKDGIFFKVKNDRLAALVVSSLSKNEIIAALKPEIDAVFLPRMIYQVSKLPRNETGKIIKSELEHLIKGLNRVTDQ
jgi:acyl-coenzyme A synthetase/AMP-(fatty) acid ligase